jgi:hypothetical protein
MAVLPTPRSAEQAQRRIAGAPERLEEGGILGSLARGEGVHERDSQVPLMFPHFDSFGNRVDLEGRY